MQIKILEVKVEKLERVVETLERKVEILENNEKSQHTPFEQDDNEFTYKELIDEWVNGKKKG